MKQRFSSLDIKVIAHELAQSIVSLRIVNVYDLSSKIFLFKLAKPDHRQQLLLDSGFRVHLTSFARTTAAAPSAFVSRLRKFLKTRRVTSVKQVGTDRVLEIQFSDGLYRLFLEFYASGNIVLTDKDLNILALQRTVTEGAEHEHVRPGGIYNLSERQNINGAPPLTAERVRDGLQLFLDRQVENEAQEASRKKSKKRKDGDILRKALGSSINELPPMLLDHAFKENGLDTSLRPEEVLKSDDLMNQVMTVLEFASNVVQEIMAANPTKGYIIAKHRDSTKNPDAGANGVADGTAPPQEASSNLLYDDYHPFKPSNAATDPTVAVLEYDGFNAAVDEFYSSIEGQKLESRLQEREEAARRKLEHARQDQEKRVGGLQAVQELNIQKAQAIEANIERVEEATAAINGLIAQGYDWENIGRLIEVEQKRNNPVAAIIKLPLKLNENTATLLLGVEDTNEDNEDENNVTDDEPSDSDDSDEDSQRKTKQDATKKQSKNSTDNRLAIDVDLALSGYSNAREYYDQRKTAAAKQEKTVQASAKALQSAQSKIESDLKKALKQEKEVLRPVRKQFWFEKFHYFISSDGYLVLGAKDALQSDIVYKKYLKSSDVFVHADLNGAAMVIVKNRSESADAPVPPATLSQAGNLCVATSSAWDSKAVMAAWWVSGAQVAKVAPTGDYLPPGSFHVKGEKNYLPPAQLILGFGSLFQISEESAARHTKHRVPIDSSPETNKGAKHVDSTNDSELKSTRDGELATDNDHEDEDEADISETASEASDNVEDGHSSYQNPLQGDHVQGHGQDGDDTDDLDDREEETSTHQEESSVATPHNPQLSIRETSEALAQEAAPEPAENSDSDEGSDTQDNSNDDDDADHIDTQSNTTASDHIGPSSTSTPQSHRPQPQPQKQAQPTQQPRGKRGKNKKLRSKYADQDDEDRAMAMAILGSRSGQEKATAENTAKQEAVEAAAAQKARRREQHLKREQEVRKAEAARDANRGEDIDANEDGEDEGSTAIDLTTFTGKPLPGDSILLALPVCAPWSALSTYKYKVKLQPGSTKRGKVVREILERWSRDAMRKGVIDEKSEDVERMWPGERDLIAAWREAEVVGVVPVGKAKIMAGGGLGAAGGKGGGGAGGSKGKARGGRGSKKSR